MNNQGENNKEVLIENIKTWIQIEDQISLLSKKLKELRDAKKKISGDLVDIMKTHEIDGFDCSKGKLAYTQNKVKKGINRKYLFEVLGKYLQDEQEAFKMCEFIMENREVEVKESIKLKKLKAQLAEN